MKRAGRVGVLFLVLWPALGMSQVDTSLTNTAPPSPVGSGARAMGTGGAFIAIADDATSASWNPGGMVQLVKPEFSYVITIDRREVDGEEVYFNSINYGSVVYPFSVGGVNIVGSLNFQRLYDFYFKNTFSTSGWRRYPGTAIYLDDGGTYAATYNFREELSEVSGSTRIVGEAGAISPAIAVQVTPRFSIGFTYNFWKDGIVGRDYANTYEHYRHGINHQRADVYFERVAPFCRCSGDGDPACTDGEIIDNPEECLAGETLIDSVSSDTVDFTSTYHSLEDISFSGQNFNVGFLWKATPRWTVGGVYRSEFTADLRRERTLRITRSGYLPGTYTYHYEENDKMRFPASYGVGLAFRYSDRLSFAGDVSRIEWDRFMYKYENGKKISPVNGLPLGRAEIDPTVSYRLGMEYLVIRPKYVVPLRAGVFYDPEPARGEPDDYYGASVGTGIVWEPLVIDLTYWYRWGEDVVLYTRYNPDTGEVREKRGDVTRQMLMLSAIIHL